MSETLGGFRGKAFEVIADECPNVADLAEMPLNFERPTFQRGFAFPEKSVVAVHEQSAFVVFGRIIAEQTEIKEIGGLRQEFERRKIAFV